MCEIFVLIVPEILSHNTNTGGKNTDGKRVKFFPARQWDVFALSSSHSCSNGVQTLKLCQPAPREWKQLQCELTAKNLSQLQIAHLISATAGSETTANYWTARTHARTLSHNSTFNQRTNTPTQHGHFYDFEWLFELGARHTTNAIYLSVGSTSAQHNTSGRSVGFLRHASRAACTRQPRRGRSVSRPASLSCRPDVLSPPGCRIADRRTEIEKVPPARRTRGAALL